MDERKRKAVNYAMHMLARLMYDNPDGLHELELGYKECIEKDDTSDFIGALERWKKEIERVIEEMR